jgi:hypothetical protein
MAEDNATTRLDAWPYLNMEPSANWRPGQKRARPKKDVTHSIKGLFRCLASVAKRQDFTLDHLAMLVDQDAPKWLLQIGVDNLRRQGHSWAVIARELGTTREAAYERFGGAS